MKNKLLLFFIVVTSNFIAQTYSVGHLSINFIDNSRAGGTSISNGVTLAGNGRVIGTEVYYPANATGYNTPVADGKFPIIVFGHGFLMDYNSYNTIFYYLVSKGYIVMLPVTEGGTSPNHGYYGRDLNFLASAGINLNTWSVPSSLTKFNGKVSEKAAIGGHSMGGGCTFFAAANNNTISCIFNLAAADITPSSITSATAVTTDALIFSGERDCVVDTNIQNSHYSNLASQNKFHIILKDLTHCDFSNGSNTNCNLGQTISGCSNQVSNSVAFSYYMNYLEPFLNYHLKDECNEGQRFMDSLNTSSSAKVGQKQLGYLGCGVISVNELDNQNYFDVFPNPTQNKIYIKNKENNNSMISVQLFDITGKELLKHKEIHEIDLSIYEEGMYILRITQNNGRDKNYKIIKH